MPPTEPIRQTSRCEQRRHQILQAAAECFRRYGFHGASIAKISAAAGMSAGHIYHFFQNKEAIIAAIVELRVEHSLALIDSLSAADDLHATLLAGIAHAVEERTRPEFVGLWLEVSAEAARNPEVAAIVQAADARMRVRITAMEEQARAAHGIQASHPPEAATEVIMALFEGVVSRAVQNPHADREAMVAMMRVAAQAILAA